MTDLRPAQALGLALWGYNTVLANSAGLTTILIELVSLVPHNKARQRLREWLKNGRQKARPCDAQGEITPCFPALLRWIVNWWQGSATLPLAIDAVSHQDRVVALVSSLQKTRRTESNCVARHWLVLAAATVWVLGCGTREEDAERLHTIPDRLCVPPDLEAPTGTNEISRFAHGSSADHRQLGRGHLWQCRWVHSGSLPAPYLHVKMTVHRTPKPGNHSNHHPQLGTVP